MPWLPLSRNTAGRENLSRSIWQEEMTTSTQILYGLHPVAECLKAGRRRVLKIFVARQKRSGRMDVLLARAAAVGVPVRRISRDELERLVVGEGHQGICARVGSYPLVDLSGLLVAAGPQPLLLLLDQIVDVQNLGSLVRTALCAGAKGVVITRKRTAQPSPAVSKASAGALEHMPLARVTNMAAAIKQLKAAGLWVAGLALVVGGEQKGIRPLVRQHCDRLMAIPQQGPLDSLNASAAGAVALFEAVRQRGVPKSAARTKEPGGA